MNTVAIVYLEAAVTQYNTFAQKAAQVEVIYVLFTLTENVSLIFASGGSFKSPNVNKAILKH